MNKNAENQRRWQDKCRKERICPSCGKPNITTKSRCSKCTEKRKKKSTDYNKRRREEAKRLGLCCSCKKRPARKDKKTCQACSDRALKRHQDRKELVFQHYGRVCSCCGEAEPLFLSVDHVDNNGATHRKAIGGGSATYKWLIDNGFPDGFQVLCRNCNWGKHINGGVCPHKESKP